MSNIREIIGNNGVWEPVGVDEKPFFRLDTTNYGGAPSNVSIAAFTWDETTNTYTAATSTIFPSGSASVSGNYISLAQFIPPVEGSKVRLEIKFTVDSSVVEVYRWLLIER